MPKIEITTPPELDSEKQKTTDLHSLVNVLNIISLQIGELDADFPKYSAELFPIEIEIQDLAGAFQMADDLLPLIEQLRKTHPKLDDLLTKMWKEISFPDHRAQIRAAKENFDSIYEILNVRLDEFVDRMNNPDVWIHISTDELEQQMQDVFSAIEKNANGRYYIHFNLALKNQDDYYIDLRIQSESADKTLWMPLRLKDVLRDLLANGRKYTKPGGKVALAVHQNHERIQCVIEDSGCGIPEDELEKVVQFGYRASNVQKYRTMGGGFGLTKAVWLVLRWGGRFFITSELNGGTTITVTIPNHPVQ